MRIKPPIAILKSEIFRLGGLEKYARRLATLLTGKGHKVSLLSLGSSSPQNTQKLPFETITGPFRNKASVFKILEFEQFCQAYLKKNPHTIVFGLDRNRFQTHLRAGNGVHRAYLKRRAEVEPKWKELRHLVNPLHQLLLHFEKRAFEHPGLQVLYTNSHMVKAEILEYYKVEPAKIRVVHNGVEWQQLESSFAVWPEAKKYFLEKHGFDPSAFHLLFIAQGFARKGLIQLLNALHLLKKHPFHLSVVGRDTHALFYKEMAKRLGLSKKISFFDSTDQIIPFYQMADALAIPSLYDPFANVTLEALSLGVRCISSKTNGAHEILNEKNGLIIESLLSPEAFAQSLKKYPTF